MIDVLSKLQGRSWRDEYALQDEIERLLVEAGIGFDREKAFTPRDRPDFFLADGTVIEVKVAGCFPPLMRQVSRYVSYKDVTRVVVVTTRNVHRAAAGTLHGKEVYVLWLRCL